MRRVLAALAALVSLAAVAARDFVDDAGRRVTLPDKVERVYAAGPPASALVFAIAPDNLLAAHRLPFLHCVKRLRQQPCRAWRRISG